MTTSTCTHPCCADQVHPRPVCMTAESMFTNAEWHDVLDAIRSGVTAAMPDSADILDAIRHAVLSEERP